MLIELFPFTRERQPADVGRLFRTEKSGYQIRVPRKCSRCGGEGRSSRWAATGFTCYDCGGSGKHKNGPRTVRVYRWSELDTLDRLRDQARARKQAVRDTKAAEAATAAEARRADFLTTERAFLAECREYLSAQEWCADILASIDRTAQMSDRQREVLTAAVSREKATRAWVATSEYLGDVGESVTVKGEVIFASARKSERFNSWSYFSVIRHDRGTVTFNGSRWFGQKGSLVSFVATVKETKRGDRNGECVTVVARPRKVEFEKLVRGDD